MNPGKVTNTTGQLYWQESGTVCALTDGERHIGHALRVGGRWHAFDATRSNHDNNGFLSLGTFASIGAAQDAIEQSYRRVVLQFVGAA